MKQLMLNEVEMFKFFQFPTFSIVFSWLYDDSTIIYDSK